MNRLISTFLSCASITPRGEVEVPLIIVIVGSKQDGQNTGAKNSFQPMVQYTYAAAGAQEYKTTF